MAIVFSSSSSRADLSRRASAGALRRVARGIYTDELDRADAEVVAAHRWEIVSALIPDAVLVDRSAAVYGLADGTLFVASATRARDVRLPGLRIAVRPGPRLESDTVWADGLHISSLARTLVDNLAVSRARGGVARTLSRTELGDWVARQARLLGGERLNRVRDEAHRVAAELGVPQRADEVDEFVAAALGTGPAPGSSRALAARAAGSAFDERRVRQFDHLATSLLETAKNLDVPDDLEEPATAGSLPFWEAYFSNYIEGTVFEVDEARAIVDSGEPPDDRPADGHDVLGTFRIVAEPDQRRRTARNVEELFTQVRDWNAFVLAGRPQSRPGEWKQLANRAGGYDFVAPDLVEGTLREGFAHRDRIANPFRRALYMFFLIAEVHPFTDGNGRVARAVMNAELTATGQSRIVIPIVWRNEYLTAVRLLSRDGNTHLYCRTMAHAWRWTAAMSWTDEATTAAMLASSDALVDSTEAAATGRRLLLPGA